jgi:predicted RNase H-like nuclease (RuvC/YqgF family)
MIPATKQAMLASLHLGFVRKEIDLYWDSVLTCRDENDKLKKEIENLNEQLQKKQTENSTCEDENENLKTQIDENVKKEIDENLKKEIENLKKEIDENLKRKFDDLKLDINYNFNFTRDFLYNFVKQTTDDLRRRISTARDHIIHYLRPDLIPNL